MSFAKMIGREDSRSYVDAHIDKTRTRSLGRLNSREIIQEPSQGKSFALEAIQRQRGRKRHIEEDLNATAPTPSLKNKKIKPADRLNQTADFTKVFGAKKHPDAAAPLKGRTVTRSSSLPPQNKIHKAATSQKPLTRKQKEKLDRTGSSEPIAIKGGSKRKELARVNSAASLTIVTRTSPHPTLEVPTLSPSSQVDDKAHLSRTVTFAPQLRLDETKTNEDQGGEPISSRAPVEQIRPRPQSLSDQFYFIRFKMFQIRPDLKWEQLEDLLPFGLQISEYLLSELEDRRIDHHVSANNIESWIEACAIIQKHDEPDLSKLMNRLLPHLRDKGYVREQNPSTWDVMWLVQTNRKVADSFLRLDFEGLELRAFPPCFRDLCFPFVEYLSCANNQFEVIPKLLLDLTPGVKTLIFRNNKIKKYPSTIFLHLESLSRFNLARNAITQMPDELGIGGEGFLPKYVQIDLSFNHIQTVDLKPLNKYRIRTAILMAGNPVNPSSLPEFTGENVHQVGSVILKWSVSV